MSKDCHAVLGCEFEIRIRTPGSSFTRHCGELASYYMVKRPNYVLVGKQKLCYKHVIKLREQGLDVSKCNA